MREAAQKRPRGAPDPGRKRPKEQQNGTNVPRAEEPAAEIQKPFNPKLKMNPANKGKRLIASLRI